MNTRILGLDTGTNSLAWAVVDRDAAGNYTLVKRGDVIFSEGVKIEKGKESSKAAERTGHKSLRVQYARRRLRKIDTLKVLVSLDLCPYLSDEQLSLWKAQKTYPLTDDFMLWQRSGSAEENNPYYCRYRCLTQKLDLTDQSQRFLLGRAFYHLAQRRGFLSNRLDTSADSEESGKVKSGIAQLSVEMEKAGCHYLGEYFYQLYRQHGNTVRLRSRYTDREEHYKKEFLAICEKQGLDAQWVEKLQSALYFQRPLKSQRKGVGKCTFEPKKPRCAESHPDYEAFRMLCILNNIKIKTPNDTLLRPLNAQEREKIWPLFFRKSKPNFDFEDIAKALAGKNNYAWIKDTGEKPYKFNYRMHQGVSGCPVTAQLIDIFGSDWKAGIAETYTAVGKKNGTKTIDEMADDVWNVLYSFSSKDKLKAFATEKLQLDEASATKFANAKLPHGFAALSLKAIRNILPFLRQGFIYAHAVLLAKIPDIVTKAVWDDAHKREQILSGLMEIIENYNPKDRGVEGTIDFCIKSHLQDVVDLRPGAADALYHPSMIEAYPDAKLNKMGVFQLGSPRTNAIRNPMAMRSLHILRSVVNQLLRDGTIDRDTEVHVEYARELNDANKRKAIADYQREQEKKRKQYRDDIITLYKSECHKEIEPTDTDILKFQLWEEQNHLCLYTGTQIGICDFLGDNPKFDIEHTIPRSVGGDSTQMNLTLCDATFNRQVKGARLPSQLPNHHEILKRIAPWESKCEDLRKKIDKIRTFSGMAKEKKDSQIQKRHRQKMELDYWQGKYERFTMTEVPEGFSRRQGAGIGLVSKYAGLFLKSLFHSADSPNKSNVYVVKGVTTAEFRRMWGLQGEYEKKSRLNHCHHCIDAITIACIGKAEYDKIAQYYHDEEVSRWHGSAGKPHFKKPWPNFTEDVLALEQSLLIKHLTKDNMPKQAKRRVRTAKGKHLAQGDAARGSLHRDTYYGAIEQEGEIRYVLRKPISKFEKESELENIVDQAVKEKIKVAVAGKNFKAAIAEPIFMNKEKGIRINKVRCYVKAKERLKIRQQRDLSTKEYKQFFCVENENNYLLAIYEGEVKGKKERDFCVVNNLDAAAYLKRSNKGKAAPLVPERSAERNLPLLAVLQRGTQVLFYEDSPEEILFDNPQDLVRRLYKVVGINTKRDVKKGKTYLYGNIELRFHQNAQKKDDVKMESGGYKNNEAPHQGIVLSHNQFKALVEDIDFEFNILGEIKKKEHHA